MRPLATILTEAAALNLTGHAAELVDELLQRSLDLEGPPTEPVEAVSTDYRRAFIRTPPTSTRPYGTPIGLAATWLTDTWRCLLLEIPSCAMARPKHLPNNYRNNEHQNNQRAFIAPAIIVLDSKSKSFQAKIIAACRCLNLTQTYTEAAVVCVFGTNRTFLAWRERQKGETFNAMLRGDTDNYTKNCLDGLQKARVISNDRGVFRLTATKTLPISWLTPPLTITQLLEQEAVKLKTAGYTYQAIKTKLVLSHQQMAKLFSDYQTTKKERSEQQPKRKVGRPTNNQYTDNDLKYAISLIKDHSWMAIQRKTGISIAKLKTELQNQLGIIPKRTCGRPVKILAVDTIARIKDLAQDGHRITTIQNILKSERLINGREPVSLRKLRAILNSNNHN